MSRLKRLIQEIHCRSLWQVLGIYLGGAWVALQGIEALADGLAMPEWVPGFAVVVLILGLPIVLATAFVQEGIGGQEVPAEAPAQSEAEGPTAAADAGVFVRIQSCAKTATCDASGIPEISNYVPPRPVAWLHRGCIHAAQIGAPIRHERIYRVV